MKRKLVISIMLLVVVSLVISNAVGIYLFRNREINSIRTNLKELLLLIDVQSQNTDKSAMADQYSSAIPDIRITFIAADGTVILDSEADAAGMENHSGRPEVREALSGGWGEDIRTSSTLSEPMLYMAKLLSDGTVARLAIPMSSVNSLIVNMSGGFVLASAVAILLCLFIASRVARQQIGQTTRIYESLEGILEGTDIPLPEEYNKYDELRPILRSIKRIIEKINTYMLDLKSERERISLILDCMEEGLILVDEKLSIIAVNKAARNFLGASDDQAGHSLLTITHNVKLRNAVRLAVEEQKSSIIDYQDPLVTGRYLRFFVNPVVQASSDSEQGNIGASVLISDVTELRRAERIRSDFTANVSHELKTPLTSIKGFTDMLSGGVVDDPETAKRFITMISVEVDRLIHLINDILKLSELESVSIDQPEERSHVLSVAREVVEMLSPVAASAQVGLTLSGADDAIILMSPGRLKELLINLIDNAVKYNLPGGGVAVDVLCERDMVSISVSDTGIGIPEEHQGRVFERFYRVDKGRSKKAGGTGLGLAIVKHITALYNGKLILESAPGAGTKITVEFFRA